MPHGSKPAAGTSARYAKLTVSHSRPDHAI